MAQEIKKVLITGSIDPATTPADLQEWDTQSMVLKNNGIERDGGVTNLYTAVESNSQYEETFYTRNDKRVRLLRDSINGAFRVFSNDIEVGRVPLWAVIERKLLTIDSNDVLATVDDTFLVLKISGGQAVIQETTEDFVIIRERSFVIPLAVSDGMFARNKAPTWDNVDSIVGIFASGTKLNFNVITDGAVVYTIGSQAGFVNSSQVFAYYENGWIVSANDTTDGRTFLLNSAGVQQGTYTEAVYLVANYNQIADTVSFLGYRNVVTLGTVTTIGNTFTPPAAPLGVWVITALTGTVADPVALNYTFGGFGLCHGTATKSFLYNNNSSSRSWVIGHSTPTEIYGFLDNGADIKIKAHTILGNSGYLSASFDADGIGVPITEVGELNGNYYPQILKCGSGCYRVVYRRGNGSFAVVSFTDGTVGRLQEIAPGVVKINTISALCIADANDNDLQYCGNAYNGFVVAGFDAVSPVQKAFVARYRGEYGGSVDTGYKSTGSVLVGSINLLVVPESVSYSPNNETIDFYYGPPPASLEYYRSIRDGNAQSVKSYYQGTLYVDDSIIPPPAGVQYFEQTFQLIGSTAIREFNYDGYQLLNETAGQYQSFRLFGSLYLFDGDWIHSTQLNNNVLQRIDHVANALGLVFLAESPTAIFFYSSFDNSIYTFDGGQSVAKLQRLSQRGTIRAGVFNARENTLALFTDNTIIFTRDGVMTESFLPITWPFSIYSTSDGIWTAQNSYAIKYLYNALISGSSVVIALDLDGGIWGTAYTDTYNGGIWGTSYTDTIVGTNQQSETGVIDPLIWQTKFNGFSDRTKQSLDRYLFRVYKQDKAETTVTVDYYAYFEDTQYHETRQITLGNVSNPYDSDGYAVFEYLPQNKNAIASSIKLTFPDKILLLDGYATVTTAGDTVAKNRGH